MPYPVRWLFVAVFFILLQGCTQPSKTGCVDLGTAKCGASQAIPGGPNNGPGGGGGGTPAEVDKSLPMSVVVQAFAEGDTNLGTSLFRKSCDIAVGSASGTQLDCQIQVPQAVLHYSQFRFSMNAAKGQCSFVRMYPYYYQASSTTGFKSEWTGFEPVDCSQSPSATDKKCYSGAGREMVQEFPKFRSLIYTPAQSAFTDSWVAPPARSMSISTNRWMSNTMSYRNNSYAWTYDGYLANSMQDWKFVCTDDYDSVNYSIKITLLNDVGTNSIVFPAWELVPPPSMPVPFDLAVNAYTESDTNLTTSTFQQNCTIDPGSPAGTQKNCQITIPQGQLYYSHFKFALNAAPAECSHVRFLPYLYKASNTSGFSPEWGNPVDCSTENASCYSGAGTELLASISSLKTLEYAPLPFIPFSQSWTVHSGHSMKRLSNRWMSNTLLNRSTPITSFLGDGYIANSMQDWQFQCTDRYDNLRYALNLSFVSDSAGGNVSFPAWEAAPPPPPVPPFDLTINGYAENDTNLVTSTFQQKCTVDAGSAVGTQKSCQIIVPQGQLYFSHFKFGLNAPAAACSYVRFYPYLYRASNANDFTAEWNGFAAVDCTGDNANCYSGPGTEILSPFPGVKNLMYIPGSSAFSQFWVAHSAHSKGRRTNRWMSNTLIDRGATVTNLNGDGYVSASMQDWSASCTDQFDNLLYGIDLSFVSDAGGGPATYPAWESVPASPVVEPPLTLQLASYWEGDTAMSTPTLQKVCTVPIAPVPAPGSAGAYIDCDITIPESQLYFSRLKFTLTAAPQTCDVVYFQPLSYQASDSSANILVMGGTPPTPSPSPVPGGGFIPNWKSNQLFDCNPVEATVPTPIECFSGPSIDLVPGFPVFRSLVYTPAWQEKFTYSWTARSGHQAGRGSNRWTSYNSNPGVGLITADGVNANYVANSMANWIFQCTSANSDVKYQFRARIFPDATAGSLGPGAPRWLGW